MTLTKLNTKGIKDNEILDADINASAAIAGTKISPNFGSQNIVTTGGLTVDTNTLHVDATNNRVGIGTTSTSRSLHISNNGSDGTQLQITGTLDSAGIKFVPASGDTFEYQAAATGCYVAYNRTDSRADMFVDGSGNVGIGTASPATLTHIYDSTDASAVTEQFRISGGDRSADTYETGFRFFTEAPSANGNRHVRFISNANTGLTIQPYETSTGNAAADRNTSLCPNGGNVGIGTTSPNSRLEVNSGSDSTKGARISGGASGGTDIADFRTNNGTIRMKINNDVTVSSGNLVIGTSGKGIDFSAVSDGSRSVSSNILDDYEEGTWTPTFPNNGTGNQALGTTLAEYVKIGRFVYAFMYANITGAPQSNSSTWVIGGLPFNANVSTLTHHGTGNVTYVGSSSYQQWRPLVTNYGQVYFHRTDGSNNVLKNSDVASEGMGYWIMGVNYMTSS